MEKIIFARLFSLFLIIGLALPSQSYTHERDKIRWDNKYDSETYLFGKFPIKFLYENVHLLPIGRVLDVAMGEGRNGVFLATKGFDVVGVDISEEGLRKAHKLAEENNVKIETRIADLENADFEKNAYEVVVCSYYMQRKLFPVMKNALKPGGMLMVETFNTDYLKYNSKFNRTRYIV